MNEDLVFHGLKVGDWATWFGAFGSLCAVVTALWLAKSEGRRRDQDRLARGRVIASFLFIDVGKLQKDVELAIKRAEFCKTLPDLRAYSEIAAVHKIVSAIDESKFANNLDKLAELPGRHGEFLAAVADMKRVLAAASAIPSHNQSVDEAHSRADLLLDQLRTMNQHANEFLKDFTPIFAT